MGMTGLLPGALAGAAGTTALNTVTYLDMAVRGRPASSIPEQMVEKVARAAGTGIAGSAEARRNRLQGLGPLAGIATGVGIGVTTGIAHQLLLARGRRLPFLLGTVLIAAAAMAASDVPLATSGVSDPRTWSATDWLSDAVPHLAYGAVTEAVLRLAD